jgi:virginiamycin B lyase
VNSTFPLGRGSESRGSHKTEWRSFLKIRIVSLVIIIILIIAAAAIMVDYLETPIPISYVSNAQTSQYTTEFPTTSSSTGPSGIAVDSKGTVWFTLENQSALAELTPSTGKIMQFKIPLGGKSGTVTWGTTVDNSRDLVWFTDQTSNSIWSFSISSHKFKQYKLHTPNCFPFGIALDSQGNVWFTEFFGNKIGEIAVNGSISEFAVPVSGSLEPSGIVVGSAGKVWFTLPGINSIGSYSSGKFDYVNLTGLVTIPAGIAIDPQGNLWLTQHGPSFISEYNPTTHYFKTISTTIPPYGTSLPYFVYTSGNGEIWFNEHEGNAESVFFPSNGTLREYYIPTQVEYLGNISGALTSNVSPSGVPWYAEFFAGKVGTINTQTPPGLHIDLPNYSQPLVLGRNGSISLQISVGGSASSSAILNESVGNLTSRLSFVINSSKSKPIITIHGNSTESGIYFVTISAITKSLAVSQVVELQVR